MESLCALKDQVPIENCRSGSSAATPHLKLRACAQTDDPDQADRCAGAAESDLMGLIGLLAAVVCLRLFNVPPEPVLAVVAVAAAIVGLVRGSCVDSGRVMPRLPGITRPTMPIVVTPAR